MGFVQSRKAAGTRVAMDLMHLGRRAGTLARSARTASTGRSAWALDSEVWAASSDFFMG